MVKIFSDVQGLRKFIARLISLKELLKDVLLKEKIHPQHTVMQKAMEKQINSSEMHYFKISIDFKFLNRNQKLKILPMAMLPLTRSIPSDHES